VVVNDLIIGSGPTAWAAAQGILARGGRPVVVDFGRQVQIAPPTIRGTSKFAMKGDLEKGRIFSYPRPLVAAADGNHLPLSSARGGLSRIWGAGILMRTVAELGIDQKLEVDFEEAYSQLFSLMPSTGTDDQTSQRFPLLRSEGVVPVSSRFKRLIETAQTRNGDVLVGYPRLSLQGGSSDCTRCGLCLSGCPDQLFFSADRAFDRLESEKRCTFVVGPVIDLCPSGDYVDVRTPFQSLRAKRVFVAAGPIGSPALLQRSGLVSNALTVHDSAVFYSGLLNLSAAQGDESDFAAAHAAFYSIDPGITDFQITAYESNDSYRTRLSEVFHVPRVLTELLKPFANRFNPLIGFLDSSVSGTLELQFDGQRTWVKRVQNPLARRAAAQSLSRLGKFLRGTRYRPVPQVVVFPYVGSGYHAGASLPLGGSDVDLSSRLRLTSGVYLVDASVLPRIPAGSHTFAAMANAYRAAHHSA
jgi:hypothetical protein